MIEYELTYLAKELPQDLGLHPFQEILDLYLPDTEVHPRLRLRKAGSCYELTKKVVLNGDLTTNEEHTIPLNSDEYRALSALPGRKIHKLRYYYPVGEYTAEINLFLGALAGLVTIEFEFENQSEMAQFAMPSFALADISHEHWASGGKLAGKDYSQLATHLDQFNYQKINY